MSLEFCRNLSNGISSPERPNINVPSLSTVYGSARFLRSYGSCIRKLFRMPSPNVNKLFRPGIPNKKIASLARFSQMV